MVVKVTEELLKEASTHKKLYGTVTKTMKLSNGQKLNIAAYRFANFLPVAEGQQVEPPPFGAQYTVPSSNKTLWVVPFCEKGDNFLIDKIVAFLFENKDKFAPSKMQNEASKFNQVATVAADMATASADMRLLVTGITTMNVENTKKFNLIYDTFAAQTGDLSDLKEIARQHDTHLKGHDDEIKGYGDEIRLLKERLSALEEERRVSVSPTLVETFVDTATETKLPKKRPATEPATEEPEAKKEGEEASPFCGQDVHESIHWWF
ncbi:MAG: hypothetical protein SGARI_004083 [Bacillariaceae sp.]